MRRRMTYLVAGLVLAVAAWIAAGAASVAGIEEPKYETVARRDGYEVRRYAPVLVAETDMATLGFADRSSGFRALAGYIFGGNRGRDKIAMTAPVVMDAPTAEKPEAGAPPRPPGPSQKIAMTAPVILDAGPREGVSADPQQPGSISRGTIGQGTMRFVMPSKFGSLADLPVPIDPRVRLVEVPARTLAVATFSWWAMESRVADKTAALLAALTRDRVEVIGRPALATYNPPFTPPFMQRHEIMVEVK